MLTFISRPLRRAAAVVAACAATAALAVTATDANVVPGTPSVPDPAQAAHADQAPLTQSAAGEGSGLFPLLARDKNGRLFDYEAKGTGGFAARIDLGGGYSSATALVQTNISANGTGTDLYAVMDNTLYYTAERGNDTKVVSSGWNQYNLIASVGNMGGSAHADLVARDKNGALWLYQGKADGTLISRVRIGATGWSAADTDIVVGRGDYTGDGKADLITRFKGMLTVHPGTGNATTDAVTGTRTASVSRAWTGTTRSDSSRWATTTGTAERI